MVRVTLLVIGEDGAIKKGVNQAAGGCGVDTVTDLAPHDIRGADVVSVRLSCGLQAFPDIGESLTDLAPPRRALSGALSRAFRPEP